MCAYISNCKYASKLTFVHMHLYAYGALMLTVVCAQNPSVLLNLLEGIHSLNWNAECVVCFLCV